MSKTKLSTQATEVYNTLLELNWSEPYLTLEHIQSATGLGRSKLLPKLAELISASKVLHGNEEALGEHIEAFTGLWITYGTYVQVMHRLLMCPRAPTLAYTCQLL